MAYLTFWLTRYFFTQKWQSSELCRCKLVNLRSWLVFTFERQIWYIGKMVNFALKPFLWNCWWNSSQDEKFPLKTNLVCMALSQDQTTQAHVSLKIFGNIDSDSARIVFHSIYCQISKCAWRKLQRRWRYKWVDLKDFGIQHNSPCRSLSYYDIPKRFV